MLGIKDVRKDVFGLGGKKSGKYIPWQWLLWGALIAFIAGFLASGLSFWILIIAAAGAFIIYLDKSTQTVDEQVLLLTDETENAKKNRKKNSVRKSSRKTPLKAVQAAGQTSASKEIHQKTEKSETSGPAGETEPDTSKKTSVTRSDRPHTRPRAKTARKATARKAKNSRSQVSGAEPSSATVPAEEK